ncbi:MAG: hypothetical protein IPI73_23440 [Betaproteobacteria bacterium]|nr:hypothetical protein [Betaproteobacteria bacterium]
MQYGSAGGFTQPLVRRNARTAAGVRDAACTVHRDCASIGRGCRRYHLDGFMRACLPCRIYQGRQTWALAVTSQQRVASLPTFQRLPKLFLAMMRISGWASGCCRTPPAVIQTIHAALVATMNDADVASRLADLGSVVELAALRNSKLSSTTNCAVGESRGRPERRDRAAVMKNPEQAATLET